MVYRVSLEWSTARATQKKIVLEKNQNQTKLNKTLSLASVSFHFHSC